LFRNMETEYGGTTYRSRTEARYAQMFDKADIEFQYEPEGFAFEEKGTCYVPDFWVPEWNSFFEVKGDHIWLRRGEWPEERCKCELLNEATGRDVMLACGSPSLSLRLQLFEADRIGWRDVYLANYVPASAILSTKKYRFDWRRSPVPVRKTFSGEGSIGLLATSIMRGLKPNKDDA
jgi:hypothetical protein